MSDYTDLIDELRSFEQAHRVQSRPFASVGRPDHEEQAERYKRAADTTEALVEERDGLKREMHARELHHFEEEQKSAGLAAVIEKVREARAGHPSCDVHPGANVVKCGWKNAVLDIDTALDAAPADALREHDAALIESLFDEVIFSWHSSYGLTVWENESHYDEGTPRPKPIKDWLRERARQVREGE